MTRQQCKKRSKNLVHDIGTYDGHYVNAIVRVCITETKTRTTNTLSVQSGIVVRGKLLSDMGVVGHIPKP